MRNQNKIRVRWRWDCVFNSGGINVGLRGGTEEVSRWDQGGIGEVESGWDQGGIEVGFGGETEVGSVWDRGGIARLDQGGIRAV